MDGWMDRRAGGRTDGWMGYRSNRRMKGGTSGRMGRLTLDIWMNRWMLGWTDGPQIGLCG